MGIFNRKPDVEKLEAKEDVEGLIKALEHKDKDVRLHAVRALGKIGDERAVDPLIKTLKDEDICEHATRALEEMAERYTAAFYATECNCNNSRCKEIVILLGKIGEPAIEPVIKVFKHRYSGSLMYANKTLKKIGEPAIEPLIKALVDKDRDAWIRMESASLLGEIKDAKAVEPLIQALEDENGWVRENAAIALEEIGELSVEPLIYSLKDKKRIRRETVELLRKIGYLRAVEPFVQSLIQDLKDKNESVRSEAAAALGEIKDAKAVEPLIQALKDKNESVRSEAAAALGEIKDAKAVEPLIQALEDENGWVQENATRSLGKIGNVRAVQPLMKCFFKEEMHPPFTHVVAEAIGSIGDKGAVEGLIKALGVPLLRVQAASALGQIGDKRAVRPLEKLLNDPLMDYDPFSYLDDVEGKERAVRKICAVVEEALEKIKKQ